MVKPVPLSVAELMVTGAVPVEVNVTGSVEAVFTVTLPNARLVGLTVNVGTAAFSCKAKLLETLPALAVRVTACAVVTEETVAVNPALLALAGTTTVAGTVTPALLLVKPTLKPPLPAAVRQRHRACIASRPRHRRAAARQRTQRCWYRRPGPRQTDHRRTISRRVTLDGQLTRRRCRRSRIELHIQRYRLRRIQGHREGGCRHGEARPTQCGRVDGHRRGPRGGQRHG